MAIDLNQAGPQRDYGTLIPEGTYARVIGHIRPGGVTLHGAEPEDHGIMKAAKHPSTVVMLDWEFTIAYGQHAKSKFWQNMTIEGGEVDEKGKSKAGSISAGTLRAIAESSRGIRADDQSPAAMQARVIKSWRSLDMVEFACRIDIQPGSDGFADQNKIGIVLTPENPEYAPVMQGQDVPPSPNIRRASPRSGGGGSGAAQTGSTYQWAQQAPPPAPAFAAPALPFTPAAPVPPQPAYVPPAPVATVDPSWPRSPDGTHAWNGAAWVPVPVVPVAPPPPPPAPVYAAPQPPPPPAPVYAAPQPPAPPAGPGGEPVPAWAQPQ